MTLSLLVNNLYTHQKTLYNKLELRIGYLQHVSTFEQTQCRTHLENRLYNINYSFNFHIQSSQQCILLVRNIAVYYLVNYLVSLSEESDMISGENIIQKVAVYINKQLLTFVLINTVPEPNQLLLYIVQILLLVQELLYQVVCKRLALLCFNISKKVSVCFLLKFIDRYLSTYQLSQLFPSHVLHQGVRNLKYLRGKSPSF